MMGVAKSTYYRQTLRDERQLVKDLALRDLLEPIHEDFPGYGYRRMLEHLLRQGVCVNGKRLRRVMKQFALFSVLKRTFRPPGVAAPKKLVFPNLIPAMELTAPNQLWATDLTYIKLAKHYVFLSAIIDVYTRKIVGWSIGRTLTHELCLESLEVAIRRENPAPGIIHHSDRGTQYVSSVYVNFLERRGFRISMSRAATPEDNAYIESFFRTLKREEVYARHYRTIEDVIRGLPKFIEDAYNKKRLHSSLGYKAPAEFEMEILNLNPADRPVQKIWGQAV